jgi:hypothetical protein
MGKTDAFDDAITKFSIAYADQTEHDYATLLKAIRADRLNATANTIAA